MRLITVAVVWLASLGGNAHCWPVFLFQVEQRGCDACQIMACLSASVIFANQAIKCPLPPPPPPPPPPPFPPSFSGSRYNPLRIIPALTIVINSNVATEQYRGKHKIKPTSCFQRSR